MRWIMTTSILLALAVRAGAAGVDDEKWNKAVQDFKDDFKKKSVVFKKRALEALPVADERTIHFIIKEQRLLESKDWWIRYASADRLARVNAPELRKALHAYYAKGSKREIREGVIAALGLVKHRDDSPVILAALDDPDWQVRRMACFAAGAQRIRDAVDKMISMIHWVDRSGKVKQAGELEPRVHSVLLFNLEEIVGTYFHTDVDQWKQYWDKNRDKTLPQVNRFDIAEYGGVKLEINDTFARRGTGHLVMVLPASHRTTTYFMPYLNQWLFARWVYINLPPVQSFPNVQKDSDGDVIYPVDLLVDAFEEVRKKYNVEKTVVMADGFTNWVAAKYEQKYPDRVSGLVMINPYATHETYSRRVDEALRSGDPDEEFWGKVSSKQLKPATALEQERYDYVRWSALIHDQSDLELAFLARLWDDPNGVTITIPKFDIRSGEGQAKLWALMFFPPKNNKLGGFEDKNRLSRFYPKNICVDLKKSAMLPFMEEPAKFEEAMRTFFDKLGPP
ncbi:MAG: hypothetical protein ACREID_02370 [Planctomycetota bacterium]